MTPKNKLDFTPMVKKAKGEEKDFIQERTKDANSWISSVTTDSDTAKRLEDKFTSDSFQNFTALMGIGTANITSAAQYGFNPISRVRTLLEWIHRGSWLGGVAIDLVAEDMTREGVNIEGDLKIEDKQAIEEEVDRLNIWGEVCATIKWSRLYGGCIAVHMVKGQNYSTKFDIDSIGEDQYKGLLVLDRWMLEPLLDDIVTEEGPHIGLPKYYRVTTNAPALREKKIHYTRIAFRLVGIPLPFWQAQMENLWGISVIERLYDRMLAYDSATTGVAQLVYKAYIRTIKIKDFREIVSSGGDALAGMVASINFMRQMQSIEGVTILDAEDEFEGTVHNAFGGLSEVLLQIAQQLSGALGVPLTRLLGQSPAGLNSTGESDMRLYAGSNHSNQKSQLGTGIVDVYKCVARSLGVKPSDNFGCTFRSIMQPSEKEKAEIAQMDTDRVLSAVEAGIPSQKTGLQELKAHSPVTDRWNTITDEEINDADDTLPPAPEKVEVAEVKASTESEEGGAKPAGGGVKPGDVLEKKAKDSRSKLRAIIDDLKNWLNLNEENSGAG